MDKTEFVFSAHCQDSYSSPEFLTEEITHGYVIETCQEGSIKTQGFKVKFI